METTKMSLQNLQNLHATNWLRVVDVIFTFLFSSFAVWSTGTLLGLLVESFSVDGYFSETFGQFNQECLETVIAEVSVFHRVIAFTFIILSGMG